MRNVGIIKEASPVYERRRRGRNKGDKGQRRTRPKGGFPGITVTTRNLLILCKYSEKREENLKE